VKIERDFGVLLPTVFVCARWVLLAKFPIRAAFVARRNVHEIDQGFDVEKPYKSSEFQRKSYNGFFLRYQGERRG